MPFKSERQRKFMWANHPEIARQWEEETKRRRVMQKAAVWLQSLLKSVLK